MIRFGIPLSAMLVMLVQLFNAQENQANQAKQNSLSTSEMTTRLFVYNNNKDTLPLEPLEVKKHFLIHLDTSNGSKTNYRAKLDHITIEDSIDVNGDGVKELILVRNYHHNWCPPNPGPCGVGCGQHTIQQYEVWDIQQKKNLFTVKNVDRGQVAITTNVMDFYGYRFKVEVNNGVFELSGGSGDLVPLEMGTYRYKGGGYKRK